MSVPSRGRIFTRKPAAVSSPSTRTAASEVAESEVGPRSTSTIGPLGSAFAALAPRTDTAAANTEKEIAVAADDFIAPAAASVPQRVGNPWLRRAPRNAAEST